MARVKTFRIHPTHGVPDKDIREFLNMCEKDGIIRTETIFIPGNLEREVDDRLTVIVTKLDDVESNGNQ